MLKLLWLFKNSAWILKWLFKRGQERYLYMQRSSYNIAAKEKDPLEAVVGNYDAHNEWTDYDDYLLKYVDEAHKGKLGLDFGCGPGRHLIKYQDRFRRLDGADISHEVIDLAFEKMAKIPDFQAPLIYVSEGNNISNFVRDDVYDFIMSSITLQHICSWNIRKAILSDMHRVLVDGGRISIQMGYGSPSPRTVGYYENKYNATNTNRALDVEILNINQVRRDMDDVGFTDFEFWIRPVGPGDIHPKWVFFTGVK